MEMVESAFDNPAYEKSPSNSQRSINGTEVEKQPQIMIQTSMMSSPEPQSQQRVHQLEPDKDKMESGSLRTDANKVLSSGPTPPPPPPPPPDMIQNENEQETQMIELQPSPSPSPSVVTRAVDGDVEAALDTVSSTLEPTPPQQISTVMEPVAVSVRHAFKSYQKGVPVLNDFNMTVPVGSIYSLLGSSGCGKTTMLSCCVGIRKLDKGDIFVFGHRPGTKESGVPGRRIGYMPQELSLYNELTIQEALNFYGRIYGMRRQEMFESTSFLIDFLDLPKATRRVGSLSGGQKRRVSIAIALLHRPELMILDEPTVGVDPLLRESIWGHLVKLVSSGTTTVIITTHYIEEARQSNVIGIMRNGRLLTEKSPEALIAEFKVNLLEDIVLALCRMDREEKRKERERSRIASAESNNRAISNNDSRNLSNHHNQHPQEPTLTSFVRKRLLNSVGDGDPGGGVGVGENNGNLAAFNNQGNQLSGLITERNKNNKDPPSPPEPRLVRNGNGNLVFNGIQLPVPLPNISKTRNTKLIPELIRRRRRKSSFGTGLQSSNSTPIRRLTALLIKNFIILMRSIGFLLFIFLVPAIQVILICLTIGSDPKGLLLGVVNPEPCDFESPNWRNISKSCPTAIKNLGGGADDDWEELSVFSCFYLAMLPPESFILQREESELKALQRIQNGYTYGFIQFPQNYSNNVLCRFGSTLIGCKKTLDEIYAGSNIILELDMSNKQIGQTMKRIFVDTYSQTLDQIKQNCAPKPEEDEIDDADDDVLSRGKKKPALSGDIPYVFKKPVYGKDDTSFREFLAPSILLGLHFFFPLCSSGVSYITEKKTGTLDRALVSGVGTTELMGGFLISQVGILIGQAGFAFLILTQVFQIEILGSVSLALFLTILVGISGMSAGFLIAMFCEEEVQAVLLAIGTFFPNILLAGMVWPLEGMERGLQYISYLLPCTLACESMRSIISRGWTLHHRSVWPGFLSTFAWILVYWFLALIIHRIKRRK